MKPASQLCLAGLGLCLLLSCCVAADAKAEEKDLSAALVAYAALDAGSGQLTIAVRCAGAEAVAIHQRTFASQPQTYGFILSPIDGPAGVLPRSGTSGGAQHPKKTAGESSPAEAKLSNVLLSGGMVYGSTFPVWKAGFWKDFPALFDKAPRWIITPGGAITLAGPGDQPGAIGRVASTSGFVLDRELWERLDKLQGR